PLLDKVIAVLRGQGVTQFTPTGCCYRGTNDLHVGRLVFDLAFDDVTSASIASHPSLLKIPEDLEEYFSTSHASLLLDTYMVDGQFPQTAQSQADAIFSGGNFSPGYKREYFDGCTHGFAVRGELSDPKIKMGKEIAFKASVEWLYEY
ncbi:hypothetical protein J3R30DRAFT_3218777, partial [Lentinula aciculospora]